ncbi:MAG TPA: peptidylprolyl isomerase [Anaeromyxobacteraceae bacterium]|nr:peptidylprolyl isomerase [Anaeromyxobacteraceae bacterium]
MKIGKGSVVSLQYKLHLGDGVVVDESEVGDPLVYLHGESQIVPGLERELEGLEVGGSKQVTVAPADGYGEADPNGVQKVPRTAFPDGFEPKAGQELVAQGPDGEPLPFVVKGVERSLEGELVIVDFNHPLAGKTLHFDVTVTEVRAATAEELEHGHAHGPEGHHHH